MGRGPSWREIGALVVGTLTLTAASIAFAYDRFALKADVQESLNRIEHKLDCVIQPAMCR